MNLFLIILLFFVLSKQIREGFSYSVNPCKKGVSYIKKDHRYLCFKDMNIKESTLDYTTPSNVPCEIVPNGNKMILYDFTNSFVEYTTPSNSNCNPYNVMITKNNIPLN
jgi:regulatory protein YycH of two-component signal transduction system YycFG